MISNESYIQDLRYRAYYDIPEKKDISSMSEIELAEWKAGLEPNSPGIIIAENEWRRREKIQLHKLNLKLTRKQNRTTIIAAIIGAIFGVVITLVGIVANNMAKNPLSENQMLIQLPEETAILSIELNRKNIDSEAERKVENLNQQDISPKSNKNKD
jgi:uncharacterized membrane protein